MLSLTLQNGARLAYRVTGPHDAEPLLLWRGGLGNMGDYDPILCAWPPRYGLIGLIDGGITVYRLVANNPQISHLITLGAQWQCSPDDPAFAILGGHDQRRLARDVSSNPTLLRSAQPRARCRSPGARLRIAVDGCAA